MIKLSKKERDNYQQGLEALELEQGLDSLLSRWANLYQKLVTAPPKRPEKQHWPIEKWLFYRLRADDLLYFFYDKALKEFQPQHLLNAFYTFNHIQATYELSSGYDHCARLKAVLFCYAGNNLDLVDHYLPEGIGASTNGHRFLVAAMNLILAIQGELEPQLVDIATTAFLSKKNSKLETAIVKALLAILQQKPRIFSQELALVTKLHKSSKWLHDFGNPIGKYLPFFSYGLYTLAFYHFAPPVFSLLETPSTSNIWWSAFQQLNEQQGFKEGQDVVEFEGPLSCIHEIKANLHLYSLS